MMPLSTGKAEFGITVYSANYFFTVFILIMKIMNIKTLSRALPLAGIVAASSFMSKPVYSQVQETKQDTFEYAVYSVVPMNNLDSIDIKPGGIKDSVFLAKAPSPEIKIKGHSVNALMVLDITNNILYKYDKSGKAKIAYPVSTGRDTLTTPGIYSISHSEYYPYKTAPESTLRHSVPCIFGDAGILLNVVNPQTGMKKPTGIMLHGRYNVDKIGIHSSGGCARMFNEDIVELANQAQRERGQYILIKRF